MLLVYNPDLCVALEGGGIINCNIPTGRVLKLNYTRVARWFVPPHVISIGLYNRSVLV